FRGLSAADMTKGLVLGIYSKEKEDDVPQFTSAGENLDKLIAGKLRETLNISGPPLKAGKTRTFYGLHQDFPSVVLVGLGKKVARIDEQENWQEGKENIRAAVAAGCRQIQDPELSSVEVDPCRDAQAAEEGAVLGLYEYDDLKQKKKMAMSVKLYGTGNQEAWQKGVLFASRQNLAAPMQTNHPLFVGKGITFDSGGISIKASANMDLMRADMGGATTICSAIVSAAKLNLPINIIGLAPLCENMPSGKANKLGDVGRARNGKTIQVDNTDAEGRLILADALCYVHTFNLKVILNATTLTGVIDVALGSGSTGVFTNSSWLWNKLLQASIETGDRVWRMPLFKHYTRQVVGCQLADVNNIGKYRSAGACTSVAFLKEFVTHPKWAHLGIAVVMTNKNKVPYLWKGMTGRPTRTLIEFLLRFSQDNA
uniref:Cytosol aminopeptidase n=1 Tax=Pan troglodytes TaxID=9598 RepID=A0A2I3TK72_PANTR